MATLEQYKNMQEIIDEKNKFDFEKLLHPYRHGGTENQPVRRTIGTIADYFLNKKKYPVDVFGAALLITFKELYHGKKFDGDGSYGSPGAQLVTYIRIKCDEILREKLKNQVMETIAGARMAVLEEVIWKINRDMMPKFLIPFAPSTWHWRRRKLKAKEREENLKNQQKE